MKTPFNIIIIGTGNVAHHLADSFLLNDNFKLLQVFNHRLTIGSKRYAKKNNCLLVTDYRYIDTTADLYLIAVKDDAIADVAKNLMPLKLKGVVVHTSGSVDMEVLTHVSPKIGVYYPLQTFYPNAVIDWKSTPILLESNSKAGLTILKKLSRRISTQVKLVNSLNRLQLHLSAVFACNFTNAMYVAAYAIVQKKLGNNSSNLLLPLMQQSFNKLQQVHPKNAQTGPAMRNDKLVMKKHLNLIKNEKQLTKVYKTLSDLIVTQQNSK